MLVRRGFESTQEHYNQAYRDSLDLFYRDVHMFTHCAKVPEEPVPYMMKDPSQIEESERLEKLLNL